MSASRRGAKRWLIVLAVIAFVTIILQRAPSQCAEAGSAAPHAAERMASNQVTVPSCPPTVGPLRINEGFTPEINETGVGSYSLNCPYGTDNPSGGSFLNNRGRALVRWSELPPTQSAVGLRCGADDRVTPNSTGDIGNVSVFSKTRLARANYDADAEFAELMAELAASLLAQVEASAIACNPEVFCPPAPAGLLLNLRPNDFDTREDIGLANYTCNYFPSEGGLDAGTLSLVVNWGPSESARWPNYFCNAAFTSSGPTGSSDFDAYVIADDRAAALRYSGHAVDEATALDLATQTLEVVRARGAACAAEAEPTPDESPTSSATPTDTPTATVTSEPKGCTPSGVVTDHRGDPMPGLRVQLHLDDEVADQRVTDASGAFAFADIAFLAEGFDFDLENEYEVGVVLRDAVEGASRFQIHYGPQAVLPDVRTLPRTIEDDLACRANFAFANIDDSYRVELGPRTPVEWRSLAFSYQHIRIAWNFATDVLGVTFDNAVPLKLYSFCSGAPAGYWLSDCSLNTASFISAATHSRDEAGIPLIQFNRSFSRRSLRGGDRPINGEYHEFGHAMMADSFGNLMPGRPDHTNHAGYSNPTSTDSWAEGFAEWFAMMVERETAGGAWWLYPTGGWHSLEDDRQATAPGSNEEVSVAGILVDMVDSSADYSAPAERRLTILEMGVTESAEDASQLLVVAEFRNDTSAEQRNVAFRVDYNARSGRARLDGIVDPSTLAPGEVGRAVWEPPAGIAPSAVIGVRVVGFSSDDDDDVSHSPREVWDAILSFRGTGAPGNGFVIDVSELYEALITGFPSESAAIDQIFINHGWYADLGAPPNGRYDSGEPIGVTSPDGANIRTLPERDPVFDARIDTGDVASTAFVQVLYPEPREALSYAFTAQVDQETGTIALAVPPAETGAVVRIVLSAEGHLPLILDDIEAATFWADAEASGYQQFVTLTATMVEGDPFADEGDSLPVALIGGAAAAVVAIVVVLLGALRLRRRRAGATSP